MQDIMNCSASYRYNFESDQYEYEIRINDRKDNYDSYVNNITCRPDEVHREENGMLIYKPTFTPSPLGALFEMEEEYDGVTQFRGTLSNGALAKRVNKNIDKKNYEILRQNAKAGVHNPLNATSSVNATARGAVGTLRAFVKRQYNVL